MTDRFGYPSPTEITACPLIPTPQQIETLHKWKKEHWKKNLKPKQKIEKLFLLCQELTDHNVSLHFVGDIPSAHYSPRTRTITLNNASIVTALHETGHALYGSSELKACSWSVKLFQSAFPKSFKKLRWEGHMLKR